MFGGGSNVGEGEVLGMALEVPVMGARACAFIWGVFMAVGPIALLCDEGLLLVLGIGGGGTIAFDLGRLVSEVPQ